VIKRLAVYFREMFPLVQRIGISYLLFFEIYFLVLLTKGKFIFNFGIPEIVGGFTVFGFLLFLRVADDFKDYETDTKLFPERPLPSGRVTKNDLKGLLIVDVLLMIVLNYFFMNNFGWFLFLMIYGALMSFWFFAKTKIQKSLPLALITHNPIQLIINAYIISFTCLKYNIEIWQYTNIVILFALYFDGLIWEIGRKVRAPEEETEYVTYSKLFGVKKVVTFIMLIMGFDLIANILMVKELSPIAMIGPVLGFMWFANECLRFIRNPREFKLITLIEKYMVGTEGYIIIWLLITYFLALVG